MPDRVVLRAPAKVNLALSVGPLRDDGFHELATVFCAVGLYDEVVLEPADELVVEVAGADAAAVPADASNLAARAVQLLAARTGRAPHVRVRLHKGIPVAGGCAGGSADAAAALVGADALWGTGLTGEEVSALAAELGSDVPFALQGGVALGTGRGERLEPVATLARFSVVLALAEGGLSTPAVYRELDRLREAGEAGRPTEVAPVLEALRDGDLPALAAGAANDLQAAAVSLRPDLADVLSAAPAALVSGSGPTVAFLVADDNAAQALAAELLDRALCRAAAVAPAPVGGVEVVG